MPILISKKKRFVDSGHGIIRRDAFWFLLKSVFGWGIELVKWGASENLGWTSIVEPLTCRASIYPSPKRGGGGVTPTPYASFRRLPCKWRCRWSTRRDAEHRLQNNRSLSFLLLQSLISRSACTLLRRTIVNRTKYCFSKNRQIQRFLSVPWVLFTMFPRNNASPRLDWRPRARNGSTVM